MKPTSPARSGLLLAVALAAGCGGDQTELKLGEEGVDSAEARITNEMIAAIKVISLQRHPEGRVGRFNQHKSLGCLDASFEVGADVPAELRHGLFAQPGKYPASLRFANATQQDDRKSDFRGLSIRVSGVSGDTLWGQQGNQDFILNSYPALFAADPEDFLSFIEATRDDKVWRYFINPRHFYSLKVALQGRAKIDNPLAIQFWSTTPYRLGENSNTAVKYSTRPCPGTEVTVAVNRSENFLTDALAAQLGKGPACLEFMVQKQTDAQSMPVENAAVIWDEEVSPFVPVATITVADQPFTASEQVAACAERSFNPWQSLAAHRPLGGMNRVRKAVYSEAAAFRTAENVERGEQ